MRLDRARAEELLGRIRGRQVAVLGDLMLDEYLFGDVDRISPEAPVPIVRVSRERAVLGGAANVAANLKSVGAEPVLVGTLRQDHAGIRLQALLRNLEIRADRLVVDPTRPTIIKTRVIGQQQQMLRIDREEPGECEDAAAAGLCASLDRALDQASALIISDYAKGTVGELVMGRVRELCAARGVPWIVDPKPSHRALYQGAPLMTPNTKELAELTGLPAKADADLAVAGQALMDTLGLQGLLAAKRRGIPVLATYHTHLPDYLPYLLDGKFPGFVKRLGRTTVKGLIRFVFSLTDSTIAPTDELAKELRAYGVRNVIVIPNGIDLGRLKATEAQKARFMRRYRMPAGRKVVLYVGRLGFEKRLDVLLAALPKLKARGWFLLVVGSGPQQEGYLREAEALGLARNARFTGMVSGEELCAAYACADVFASASDSETFGLTFIEAMSFGVPAVGVDKLGPREIIRDGVNGFLVKPGDSAAMAKRMDMLLSDGKLRKRLGAQAKATAGRFTIESSAEATLQAYREVVGAKGRKHGWKRLIPAMEWTPGRCMPGSQ